MRAPLYALALRITGGPGAGLGALRLLERVGAIIGLGASALLLDDFGAERSLNMLGTAVIFGIAVYAMFEIVDRYRLSGTRA
jgi:hypothetical protein